MKNKILFVCLLIIAMAVYLFFFLGIELELKNSIEMIGYKDERLINSSFKIRDFINVQLGITVLLLVICLYLIFKRK